MTDTDKLLEELETLRVRLADMEQAEIDRRRTQESLREREARYRTALEEAADAVVSLDSDLNIIAWSAGAERTFGYSKEDILGRSLAILVPEHDRQATVETLKTARKQGFVRGWETQRVAKDGRMVDVGSVMLDRRGMV